MTKVILTFVSFVYDFPPGWSHVGYDFIAIVLKFHIICPAVGHFILETHAKTSLFKRLLKHFSVLVESIHVGEEIYDKVDRGGRRRQWHPTPVFQCLENLPVPGKSHGQRNLVTCSPWGHEESDTTEWLHFHFSLSCIGEGNGSPLQCSCLENPRDGEAW